MKKMRILVACAVVACASAQAQQPAPAIAPSTCQKPADYVPVGGGTSSQMARIQKNIDEYKNCVNAYAKTNQAKAVELAAQAQAYQDSANKVIEEYNAFVNDMNAKANPPK